MHLVHCVDSIDTCLVSTISSQVEFLKRSTQTQSRVSRLQENAMRLETINVSGFRSVKSACLSNCGGFNVLIGKNNSGKSNLLLAIHGFFQAVRGGEVVAIKPPYPRSVDHFQNETSAPINFDLTFQLTLAERDALIQDIVSEAPSVKNTVEGMDPELRLRVSVSIVSNPSSFAFVKQIVLCKPRANDCDVPEIAATILDITDPAAEELANRFLTIRSMEQEVDQLNDYVKNQYAMDSEDWKRARESGIRFIPFRLTSARPIPSELEGRLNELVRKSETQSEFSESMRTLIAKIQARIPLIDQAPLKNRVGSFSGQEETIPKYVLNLMKRLAELKVLYLTERRQPIGRAEAERLLQLKIKRGGPEKLRTIQQTVSSLLGVEIDAFQSGSSGSEETGAELDVDQFLVQVNGAGIREALRLILDYEFARPDILLVEEPEIHLHPALETSMLRYMKRVASESQIFITTHSTNFLDTAEMRNVYLVSKDSSTNVQLIDMAEAQNSIPKELGLRLSSVFMFDRLVFVEGPTDEEVLRELSATLDINLAQANVGFVPMGGVRNLASYATENTIGFLSKRQVGLWFVMDRDERDDVEVQKLVQSLGTKAKTVVLKRRELENYLIVPSALREFIKLKGSLGGNQTAVAPTEVEILKAIDEAADRLKEITVERRVIKEFSVPVFPNRRQLLDTSKSLQDRIETEIGTRRDKLKAIESQINKTIENHRKFLDENWAADKTNIVPGDELLDDICKNFGVRFNKDRDCGRLASLISRTEIPNELRDLLREIVT